MVVKNAVATLVVVLMGMSLVNVPAHAAAASPAAITADCSSATGVTATTITGRVGDTVTLQNTSGTCTFAAMAGVVSATNLTGTPATQLGPGSTSTLTIVAAGTFTIQPASFTAVAFTVVIGDPNPAPEYVITFDANGGDCSSNPLVITAAANDWYSAPTDGKGPFQCHRDDYHLMGWSHGSTIALPGAASQLPDVVLPKPDPETGTVPDVKHAMVTDHVTLYAVWVPDGVEITYDANVAAVDACVDSAGDNLSPSQRTTSKRVYYASSNHTVASTAPCSPVDAAGRPLPLKGWALSGDGDPVFIPGESIAKQRFRSSERPGLETGKTVTLYAKWSNPENYGGEYWVVDDNLKIVYSVDTATQEMVLTFTLMNGKSGWVGLTFNEFMFPGDSIVAWWDAEADQPMALDLYNPGIPTLESFPAPVQDTNPVIRVPGGDPYDNKDNIVSVDGSQIDGFTTITVRRELITQDILDFQIYPDQLFHVVAAYNDSVGWNTEYNAQQAEHTAYGSDTWGF